MYNLLMFCSITIGLIIAGVFGSTNNSACSLKNFYGGIAIFLLFSLPMFISYLEEKNVSQVEREKKIKIAKKLRWIFPYEYGIQKNPVGLLVISIFFGTIAISMIFTKICKF